MFLTTLILTALLLVACGGQETTTSVPGTNVPPVTAESTATMEGGTSTETVDPNMTLTPAVPVTGEESPSRVTNLLDFGVWNQNGEQIGDVEDLVLDLDNTMISYVIVGTGGFLELGEKEVAIPWDMLEVQTGAGDATGSQQNAFIFTGDQELYNNAPDTDVTGMMPGMGQPAGDWDADIRGFWEGGVVPDAAEAEGTATVDGAASPATDATATATLSTGPGQGQGQAQDLQGVMLASEILGSTIQVRGNEQALDTDPAVVGTADPNATGVATADPNATATTGDTGSVTDPGQGAEMMDVTVEDLIVNPDTGEIRYLVVTGGFAEGERWIPVPLGFVQWDAASQNFLIRVNAAALQNAPVFEAGEFPDMSVEGWDEEFRAFWDNPDNTGGPG
jgi:sporulation protein YlmC with PRC-barrel domain